VQLTILQLGMNRVLHEDEIDPSPDDVLMMNGVPHECWDFDPKTGKLSDAKFFRWQILEDKAKAVYKDNVSKERALLVSLLKFMSVEMKRSLDNLPDAEVALASHDLFFIWPFLLMAVSMPGPMIGTMATLVQSKDLDKYYSDLRIFQAEFKDLLQHPDIVKFPSMISIDTLMALMFLNGV
jgi:hypothetical protein